MPATEQTWRDSKLLHVVFGLTALAMLATTLWMLAADHLREWKDYQRKFRDVETWTAQSRIDEQETARFDKETRDLENVLHEAQAQVPPKAEVEQFITEASVKKFAASTRQIDNIRSAYRELQKQQEISAKQQDRIDKRKDLLQSMQDVIKKARFDEDNRQRELKFTRADLDVVRSQYSLGVDEGMNEADLGNIQRRIDEIEGRVEELNLDAQAAKTHRLALEASYGRVTAAETAAQKTLDDHQAIVGRLVKAKQERAPNLGKTILEMPIIDAFGRPLKVEQIWLPQLTLNNNFRDVARFDRCTTCHQGIEKTAPGSATDAGYQPEHPVKLSLETPKQPPAAEGSGDTAHKLETIYGLKLADKGLIDASDVTVEVVWPRTPAARSGLMAGDVIRQIADVHILNKQLAHTYLLDSVKWGQPIQMVVSRGVPQPFSSHPRLDLFVGSLSPHTVGDFGCTICHEGQGSGTAFKWASHTPNDPEQAARWKRDHGWFNNHHWIFPMLPDRFAESSCLKCHHGVAELEASERFPEPPAPKLMAGYNVIRQYGCFGCHEINGWDGPSKRRGPDMRAEPNYFAAAQQVLADPALTTEQRRLAHEVADHPEQSETRKRLAESIRLAAPIPQVPGERQAPPQKGPQLAAATVKMAGILGADDATPGQLRRVGPSLRHLASKVDRAFVYNWVRNPKDFRPNTKMPQFFGLDAHLLPDEEIDQKTHETVVVESPGLRDSKRFEPIEIRGVTEYLLAASQKFEYLDPPKGVTEKASAERGKLQFQTRGCLACHRHPDFPEATNTQGPDLSRIGSKLVGEHGRKWLYSWVRAPSRYHTRTLMPNVFLEPIEQPGGKTATDPAADITAYLLSSQGWKPQPLPPVDVKHLDELTRMFLAGTFTEQQAGDYVNGGIPIDMAAELKGDEAELLARKGISTDELVHKKLLYIGRRTITRYGCSGCHDIPGYEDAKPIGTGLADWGRKETSKLAFEQILAYLGRTLERHGHHGDEHHLTSEDMPPDQGFYVDALLSHQREGFIWQKLREPRSYDYKKTETKSYTDRLRMPQFNFTPDQREAVITFVLGLVAEPPAAKYVYKGAPRRDAIAKGEQLLAKYNCTGCHTVGLEQWAFDYKPYDGKDDSSFQPPTPVVDYPFVLPHFTPDQLAASKKTDRRGLGHAVLTGAPNPEVGEDEDGNPLYFFGLWKSTAIDGHAWPAGGQEVPIPAASITGKEPPRGGALARLLHPVVLAMEKKTNPNAKASDAWGWVPPPLIHEGIKVQTNWLHDFLLDPYPIRPAVVLRMPKFNMSSDEASQLAAYFAAVDDAQYPFAFDPRTRADYLSSEESRHAHRLDDALKVVTDNNYCVKCHRINDFAPQGAISAQAPQLDRVWQRLRPEYLERWIANPKRLLPYTGMPVNFPIDKPADQKLFKGSSEQQVEAVVDLLLNWPTVMKDRGPLKIKPAPAAPNTSASK